MEKAEILTLTIIAITGATSYVGFQNNLYNQVFQRFCLHVGSILGKDKQWDRLLSSALVHADWLHLAFNMMTLWFFAPTMIRVFGFIQFLILYIASILGGSLLSLWVHRKEYSYTAIGASGGVMGVIYAFIAVAPTAKMSFFFIPIFIPAWLFGIIYLGISIYGFNKRIGNIGHDAHIGGAAVGLLAALIYKPNLILINWYYILINVVLILGFLFYLKRNK